MKIKRLLSQILANRKNRLLYIVAAKPISFAAVKDIRL